MRIIVSVVSHRHHDVIINLMTLKMLASQDEVIVLCRDNKPISKLRNYCESHGIIYLPNINESGFSKNNNLNFIYYQKNLNPKPSDYFLILNPDVMVSENAILLLKDEIHKNLGPFIYTANLFLDAEYMAQDDNIRLYPRFFDFVRTFLFDNRKTMIDRRSGLPSKVEYWCSGAFMLVNQAVYKKLRGLNEKYYLYCEDIDFCYRAKQQNIELKYLEQVKAVHFRQRESKRFFTKYFFWHVQSVFIFQICKLFPSLNMSSIEVQEK